MLKYHFEKVKVTQTKKYFCKSVKLSGIKYT